METKPSTNMEDEDGSTEPMLSPGGENGHYPTTQNGHTPLDKKPSKTELNGAADKKDQDGRWYLASLILKQIWRHLVMTCILSTIVETCCFAQPFLILVIVRGDPPASVCVRYACAAGIILYNFLQSSLRTLSRHLLDLAVIRTRHFLGGLLGAKVSSNRKSASRDPDVMYVVLSLDVERFCQTLAAVDVVLVGPMSLLAAFTILFRFDGAAALPAFGFVGLTLLLRICMGAWVAILLTRTLQWTTRRLAILKEALRKFEAIKIICLEDNYMRKLSRYSGREMAVIWRCVLLSAFGRGVGQVTGRVSIYFIVIVLLHVNSHVPLQTVILVVSYMRILEYNVFSRLPLSFGSLSQMWHLLQRFQDFLDGREPERTMTDSYGEAVLLDGSDEDLLDKDLAEPPAGLLPHRDSLTQVPPVLEQPRTGGRRESSWGSCLMMLCSWPRPLFVSLVVLCASITQVSGILVDWWTIKSSDTSDITYINETRWNASVVTEFKRTTLRGDLHSYSLFIISHVIGELLLDGFSVYLLTSCLRQLHHGMARGLLYTKLTNVKVLSIGATLNTFSRDFVYFAMYDFHSLYALSMGSLKILSILLFVCIMFPWLVLPTVAYIVGLILLTIYTRRKANSSSQQLPLGADEYTFCDAQTFCFTKRLPQNLRRRWYHLCTIRLWHRLRVNLLTSMFCSCVILHIVLSGRAEGQRWPSALVLIYLITFLNWVQDSIGEYKNHVLPIQRMQTFAHFKPEVEEGRGEWCDWPASGQVTFRQLSLLDNEIQHCDDLIIPSGQKVGILYGDMAEGRQFLHTLLGLEDHPGGMYLDGLDVTTVSTHSLRTAITVIHPELMYSTGQLRDYLDPRQYLSDDALWDALDRVSLKQKVREVTPTLRYDLQTFSDQLDEVERQLLGVARAVLHNSQVVVVWTDDLHSDIRSDYEVQDVIRYQLPQSTRIRMTPSVRRIISCDRILVLDEGCISEYTNPWRLLVYGEPHYEQLAREVGHEEAAQIRALTQDFYRQATRMDSIPEEEEEEEEGESGNNDDL